MSLQTRIGDFITAIGADIKALYTADGLKLVKSSNLSDVANANTARTNLGIGSIGVKAQGDYATSNLGGSEKFAIPSLTAGVLAIDAAAGSVQVLTTGITANITSWTFANLPSSVSTTLTIMIPMGATLKSIAAPPGTLHWLTPIPTLVINKYTVYTCLTVDAGTNWFIAAVTEA